jgi:outer membrane receptor for Fe3+-dicitrate
MKITMKEGYEITEEIENIAKYYDFNYYYIDNYGQMKEAEYKNNEIMNKLKELNVLAIDK